MAVTDLPLWKRCLDPELQEAGHYNDYVHTPLFSLIEGTPRRVLDLGCATGAFGAALKQRYDGVTVVGIEAGERAARRARERLDRVIHARIEDVDFAASGFGAGEFDTVIASDILEHLVNPWDVLARLRPHLAADAQVVASIPNARNITVAAPLLGEGAFRYDERGLLDITHLRFFTLATIHQMFAETGYRVEHHVGLLLPQLEAAYRQYQAQGARQVRLGRITLDDVSPQDLVELCTAQFLVRARPIRA
jgi:2-polyprenyl-3-methyl-5-hydroxy-6-metoxy-1,4-benzoquinol methylase